MILNRAEFALVNNWIRPAVQRWYEAPKLLRLGGRMYGGRALEIGCGGGYGLPLICDLFGADRVDGFDLDPRMVTRARRRHVGEGRINVWVGDATAVAVPSATYDAVFDFGIIHHVPDWREALREAHRVLKPGGRIYVEEVLAQFIRHPLVRRILTHPMHDRFDAAELESQVQRCGFTLTGREEMLGAFAWVTATKPDSAAAAIG